MTDPNTPPDHHRYRLYGLSIGSDLELPELSGDAGRAHGSDVVITVGTIADPNQEPGFSASGEGQLLVIAGVARMLVEGGRSIRVEPVRGVPAANIRLFLLGSAMGLLLHQRGLLPLHGNAVVVDGHAIVFIGESGAGKSTLAAWFDQAGYLVLADDVSLIRFDDGGRPEVAPGLPRLRLWRQAIEAFGRSSDDFSASFAGDDAYDKFDVPVTSDRGAAVPLKSIYLLERGSKAQIDRLSSVDAIEALFAHTYRGAHLGKTANQERHWQACVSMVEQVPVFRFKRRWGLTGLSEGAEHALAHAHAS